MVIADVPPFVAQVMRQAAAGERGAVVYARHTSIDVHAGPIHFTQINDAVLMMSNGTDRRVRFLRVIQNGRAQSGEQITKMGTEVTDNLQHGKAFFKEPYLARFAADYIYDVNWACTCPRSERDIHFTSTIHDDQHGYGDMRVDAATARLRSETYTPYVFPPHADGGTITETFGQALRGLWTVVRVDRYYTGRVLFISGYGVVSEVFHQFRRFPNAGAGMPFFRMASR